MKDERISVLFMTGVLVVCLFMFLTVLGKSMGTSGERDRLYTKCLTEHESLPHKDAVALCKERVK